MFLTSLLGSVVRAWTGEGLCEAFTDPFHADVESYLDCKCPRYPFVTLNRRGLVIHGRLASPFSIRLVQSSESGSGNCLRV